MAPGYWTVSDTPGWVPQVYSYTQPVSHTARLIHDDVCLTEAEELSLAGDDGLLSTIIQSSKGRHDKYWKLMIKHGCQNRIFTNKLHNFSRFGNIHLHTHQVWHNLEQINHRPINRIYIYIYIYIYVCVCVCVILDRGSVLFRFNVCVTGRGDIAPTGYALSCGMVRPGRFTEIWNMPQTNTKPHKQRPPPHTHTHVCHKDRCHSVFLSNEDHSVTVTPVPSCLRHSLLSWLFAWDSHHIITGWWGRKMLYNIWW